MEGYWYSVRQNFSFSRTELSQLFWTSLAFGFALSFRKWGGDVFDFKVGILNLLFYSAAVFFSMYVHVSLQKLIGIRLGYKVTYNYWLNGLLFTIFLSFLSIGYIAFLLPGSVVLEHIPKLRLGKFRYGFNLKDIARISLAGPIAHIVLVMIIGSVFFITEYNEAVLAIIFINLLLAIYSMFPIPKIDFPSKMDTATDGLGIFFFSRTLYVLVFITVLVFSLLTYTSITVTSLGWLFVISLFIGIVVSALYSIYVEQKN
ncbi:MAG: hypothetical protein QXK76_01270 [Candidatus Woesearchaeota archaeon]